MGLTRTIGGERLGSGKKMDVHLHGYERSTHDMSYVWRSTMSAGTLVPFLVEVALPGDTFDIDLQCEIMTHPTVGPLFGGFKVQLDVFQAPIRLYQGKLHNNKMGIGMAMENIKLPIMQLFVDPDADINDDNPDNAQINASCILSYLGIRGVGIVDSTETFEDSYREFNAVPLLMYWDVYKNYYANKMETQGWVIHSPLEPIIATVDSVILTVEGVTVTLDQGMPAGEAYAMVVPNGMIINYTGTRPNLSQEILYTSLGPITLESAIEIIGESTGIINGYWKINGTTSVYSWQYIQPGDTPIGPPKPYAFTLANLDQMREEILVWTKNAQRFNIGNLGAGSTVEPYQNLLAWVDGQSPYLGTQEGLALKTYQSDLFNNWLNEEWVDGVNGINEITSVEIVDDKFSMPTLILARKVYDMLNRIAVSGGTYNDWLEVQWDHEQFRKCETPMYEGGLIRELVFQEVISNSETQDQALGTLGGRGVMGQKKKGGNMTVRVDEPGYIMGIISLTPRVDYSQGNKWDVNLKTMDDLHKPALDQIGYQDLITEQMGWWTTKKTLGSNTWVQKSAGKQPAWMNYMTNVNQVRGNFAVLDNEMFMTLNRRYEKLADDIADLTTYIDPVKFNQSFAQTAIDAQNFWAQIGVGMTVRRKISAKAIPNL